MKGFIITLVVISLFIGFVSLLVIGEKKYDARFAACRAKGGIPYHSRDSGTICIKPEALIDP